MKVGVLLRLGLYAGFGCGSKVMKDKQRKDLSTDDETRQQPKKIVSGGALAKLPWSANNKVFKN